MTRAERLDFLADKLDLAATHPGTSPATKAEAARIAPMCRAAAAINRMRAAGRKEAIAGPYKTR